MKTGGRVTANTRPQNRQSLRESLSLSLSVFDTRWSYGGPRWWLLFSLVSRGKPTCARYLDTGPSSHASDSLVPQTTGFRPSLALSVFTPPTKTLLFLTGYLVPHAVINYVSFAFETDIVARAPGMRIPALPPSLRPFFSSPLLSFSAAQLSFSPRCVI